MKLIMMILLILGSLQIPTAEASFDSNQRRYLSPYDLFKTLNKLFAISAEQKNSLPGQCLELSTSNRAVLGDSQPAVGRPAMTQPSSGFIRWYAICLTSYIDISMNQASHLWEKNQKKSGSLTALVGPDVMAWLHQQTQQKSVASLAVRWQELKPKDQDQFIRFQISRMIGPESVLTDFGVCTSELDLIRLIEKSFDGTESLQAALQKTMFFLGMRDEFLSY